MGFGFGLPTRVLQATGTVKHGPSQQSRARYIVGLVARKKVLRAFLLYSPCIAYWQAIYTYIYVCMLPVHTVLHCD